MQLLKKINILGKQYKVEYFNFEDKVQLNGLNGSILYGKHTIQINTDNDKPTQQEALLHESVHAISRDFALHMDEESVIRLTSGLYQVLKDNKLLKGE